MHIKCKIFVLLHFIAILSHNKKIQAPYGCLDLFILIENIMTDGEVREAYYAVASFSLPPCALYRA